jgi:hypothetical protein
MGAEQASISNKLRIPPKDYFGLARFSIYIEKRSLHTNLS